MYNKYLPSYGTAEDIRRVLEGIKNKLKQNDKEQSSVEFRIVFLFV
jgi:hypothetical protein